MNFVTRIDAAAHCAIVDGAWTAVVLPLLDWLYLSMVAQASVSSFRHTDQNLFNLETVVFLSDVQCNTLVPSPLIFTFIWTFV